MDTFLCTPDFPHGAAKRLALLLARLESIITIHADLLQEIELPRLVEGNPLIVVRITPSPVRIKVELFVQPLAEQLLYYKIGQGRDVIFHETADECIQLVRNRKEEMKNFLSARRILRDALQDKNVEDVAFFDEYSSCLKAVARFKRIKGVSRTEWPDGEERTAVLGPIGLDCLTLSLKKGEQWLEVDGELAVNSESTVKLPNLLEGIRQSKDGVVKLIGWNFLILNEQLYQMLKDLERMLIFDPQKQLKVSVLQLPLLRKLEKDGATLIIDEASQEFCQRMEESARMEFPVPETLQGTLRNYQLEGYQWLRRMAHWSTGACLADDTGLGKTLQSIALLLSCASEGTSLVVAPSAVFHKWKEEINRFAPSLNTLSIHGKGRRDSLFDSVSAYDVVITTNFILAKEPIELIAKKWNVVVFDEVENCNWKNKRTVEAVGKLRANFRLFLSEISIENTPHEVWSFIQYVSPGLFGTFCKYTERYIKPISKTEPLRRDELREIWQPFQLRRCREEVINELSEKKEVIIDIQLSAEELKLYAMERVKLLAENHQDDSLFEYRAANALNVLRQKIFSPNQQNRRTKFATNSSKMKALLKLVNELIAAHCQIVIFTSFYRNQEFVCEELNKHKIRYFDFFYRSIASKQTAIIQAFQRGDKSVIILDPKASKMPIDLNAADCIIYLEPWWSTADEEREFEHTFSIGEVRPVTIYKLIAKQTIEEKVYLLQQSKKNNAFKGHVSQKLTIKKVWSFVEERELRAR